MEKVIPFLGPFDGGKEQKKGRKIGSDSGEGITI
jgi:hypothetical protein